LNIDTTQVLNAASTKWNFIHYKPGLVGGHCIGVDPYYLAHKAQSVGYFPDVILAGRRVNDMMGKFIAEKVVKLFIVQEKVISKCKVLILGCAFKENIGDTRNSRVFDIYSGLQGYHIAIDFVDPLVNDALIAAKGLIVEKEIDLSKQYDAIILAVKHDIFVKYPLDLLKTISVLGQLNLFDVKAFYNREEALATAKYYWRL
jgi:UDP-N-acetyl-D-galactosamine dehydrogenase